MTDPLPDSEPWTGLIHHKGRRLRFAFRVADGAAILWVPGGPVLARGTVAGFDVDVHSGEPEDRDTLRKAWRWMWS